MSAGLAASTVAPGSTAPVLSRATPVIVPVARFCANAVNGSSKSAPDRISRRKQPFVIASPPLSEDNTQRAPKLERSAHEQAPTDHLVRCLPGEPCREGGRCDVDLIRCLRDLKRQEGLKKISRPRHRPTADAWRASTTAAG